MATPIQNRRTAARRAAAPGDWLDVPGLPGRPCRRGQVIEVLGRPGHEHFRVRWDEEHESILYPGDATRLVEPRSRA